MRFVEGFHGKGVVGLMSNTSPQTHAPVNSFNTSAPIRLPSFSKSDSKHIFNTLKTVPRYICNSIYLFFIFSKYIMIVKQLGCIHPRPKAIQLLPLIQAFETNRVSEEIYSTLVFLDAHAFYDNSCFRFI